MSTTGDLFKCLVTWMSIWIALKPLTADLSCLLTFVHCLCLCSGEQGLAGDERTAEQASSGLHINTSCALASHSIPRVGVLGRDTSCCLPDGTQRVLKKA